MPEIPGSVEDFAGARDAQTISPITSPGPSQRGPTCGFYALGYVMNYWFERQQRTGQNQNLSAPLPVRTNAAPKQEQSGFFGKGLKTAGAMVGQYSSLRHFGKYNKLTAYGSVFNAESMVKLARGQGSQYAGQYDGRVIATTDTSDLIATARKYLTESCPLIIPFDVGDDGDPGTAWTGERAHWAVLVGFYEESGEEYFLHYHWGKYRYAKAQAFADSNYNLTSNKLVQFQKVEVKNPRGVVVRRDYVGPSFSSQVPGLSGKGFTVTNLGGPQQNLEVNNPSVLQAPNAKTKVALQNHGFDPDNLAGAGLVKKIVAVFPQALSARLAAL